MARAFLGERPKDYVVHHKDGNKKNNVLENLQYINRSQNAIESIKLNKWPDCRGSKHPSSKLKEFQVVEMRELYIKGARQNELATMFGIKQPTVSEIVNLKKWTHI